MPQSEFRVASCIEKDSALCVKLDHFLGRQHIHHWAATCYNSSILALFGQDITSQVPNFNGDARGWGLGALNCGYSSNANDAIISLFRAVFIDTGSALQCFGLVYVGLGRMSLLFRDK